MKINVLDLALHYVGRNFENISVIQIGACDGISWDDTRAYADVYKWKALLVEPIPELFEELKNNLKDRENQSFEQAAITTFDGEIEMLTVPKQNILDNDLHPGYKGMSALYPLKNGFGSDYWRDIEVKEKYAVNIKVPALTLDSLFKKHNIDHFDIFVCDAEGHDWEILNQIDFSKYRPKVIKIEYRNLTVEEKAMAIAKLKSNGYYIDEEKLDFGSLDLDAVDAKLWNTIMSIENNKKINIETPVMSTMNSKNLEQCIVSNRSDKVRSGYHEYYGPVFEPIRSLITSILEIGIGSKLDVPSTMAGVPDAEYKPGASLRAWKDYFYNAQVSGIDIGEDCKFEEERIKTYIFSSLDKVKADQELGASMFDIILDDGLHTALGQLMTLQNFFYRVNNGGYYIIEDIGGGGDGSNLIADFEKEFRKIADTHEWVWIDSHLAIIRKNHSGKGKIETFEEFLGVEKKQSPKNIINIPNTDDERNNIAINFDTSLLSKVDLLSKEERENLIKYLSLPPYIETNNKDLTIVTGLWNINRPGRDFNHYIEHFKKFLEMPYNMFIFIPAEYEYLVWEKRSKKNTYVKIFELSDIKNNYYANFWDRTQKIRTNPEWYNQTGEHGWLTNSPQAVLEWYNPIVQSKMFMLSDASIWNPFDTEYFIWLDAGISNTVYDKYFSENKVLDKINPYLDSFLFLSYPYETNSEIHGFNKQEIDMLAGADVNYVCRGGLFGGRKEIIREANADYYNLLDGTLNRGLMGTEESIFSIMANINPRLYRRYALDGNGLIIKFIQALDENKVELVPLNKTNAKVKVRNPSLTGIKTSSYMLTFNFPQQVEHTIKTWEQNSSDWLKKPYKKVLIDNSNKQEAIDGNKAICDRYGFEHIITGENLGINRGRQFAAEHFDNSDSDYYFFFEDDMGFNPSSDNGVCRNGFRKYIPQLYDKVHKIMLREQFDFMKLSYTEVYMDNNIQVSWYNVPQVVRTRDWPDYDKLPISGLDPNAPRTKFKNIDVFEDLSYISGDIYYANWPMIVGKEGNKKMFIDTKWAHPWEQTWMSYMYQETVAGNLNPAVLLASPVWHNRIIYYEPHERREN